MLFPYGLSFLRRRPVVGALFALAAFPVSADPIRHPTAIFAGLDKTTGRIINFDVAIDETVQFGSLQVTAKVCNTRPQTETPQTTSFVEIDEQATKPEQKRDSKTEAKPEIKRVFSGWMFAASPGLHGVEHPVYDVWLVDCKGGKEVVAQQPPTAAPAPAPAAAPEPNKRSGRARKVEPAAPAAVEAQPIGPADEPVFGESLKMDPALDPAQSETPPAEKPKRPRKKKPAAPAEAAPAADPGMAF
ncbi:DUF2155 domain-containing protein [Methylocystis heyeri]|uniref:DUF2155 domain-containing protein n=1 Tax=Methylocystis heyeri TaxID=391905 RepID=A0A6B8KF24_9HYPH|nr:DUF2155 domain-containing protein [Methylocystis heyeri]QGM45605.1 DUF2155 domain-containing protein [Methylocystis heyeri]